MQKVVERSPGTFHRAKRRRSWFRSTAQRLRSWSLIRLRGINIMKDQPHIAKQEFANHKKLFQLLTERYVAFKYMFPYVKFRNTTRLMWRIGMLAEIWGTI